MDLNILFFLLYNLSEYSYRLNSIVETLFDYLNNVYEMKIRLVCVADVKQNRIVLL